MAPFGPVPAMVGNDTSFKRAGVAAKRFQRFDGIDLGQRARWRLAVDPGEKTRQRDRVAPVRGAGALDLGGVLDGLQ